MSRYVKFPFGTASTPSIAFADVIEIPVKNMETIIDISQVTSAATIHLNIGNEVDPGANLTIIVHGDDEAGFNITFGDGMTAATHTVTKEKDFAYSFKFNGSSFVQTAVMQLN